LPELRQCFQLAAEDRPVPEVIPARGYLVEYVDDYLTPFIPLSFKGEREIYRRGARPL
jgi:hypothetical protein